MSRVGELAADIGNVDAPFDAYYGLFVSSLLRGELSTAWQTAEAFRREADNEARMMEASVAHRNLGMACLYQGDFVAAQANFMQALTLYDPVRDREAKFRFGTDCGAGATAYLAPDKVAPRRDGTSARADRSRSRGRWHRPTPRRLP